MKNISRYEIKSILGQGNMATVYEAHDPRINRTLAIKVMRKEKCADNESRTRFLREGKAVGALNHPNIVTIYDVSELDSTPYIAMEMINGTSLDKLIKQDHSFSFDQIAQLGIQLANALHFAHTRNIIHRDIKPSNIILSDDFRTVKITDFGIARVEEVEITQLTQIGNLLGTPQYMSPEQVNGEKADARSDLFSLGSILYQLLTGKRAFSGQGLAKVLFQIATESPEPIENLRPETPDILKQAVTRLLEKDPQKRYQSGEELAAALELSLEQMNPHALNRVFAFSRSGFNTLGFFLTIALIFSSCVSIGAFHFSQSQKLSDDFVISHADSLSKFMSESAAESLLSQDWRSLEILVKDFQEKYHLNSIAFADREHIIKASNEADRLNRNLNAPRVFSFDIYESNYQFTTPVRFGDQDIGALQFGIVRRSVFEQFNLGQIATPTLALGASLLLLSVISLFSISRIRK